MKLIKKAKRGADKTLHNGNFYTAGVYGHATMPTEFYLRLQDENGDMAYSVNLSLDELEYALPHMTTFIAKARKAASK